MIYYTILYDCMNVISIRQAPEVPGGAARAHGGGQGTGHRRQASKCNIIV